MFNSFNGLEPTCIVQTCHVVLLLQPIRNSVTDSWVYYHCFDLSVIFNRVLQFADLASEAQFIFLPLSSRSAFEIKAACSEVDWGSYESFVIQRRMYYSRICVCVCVWASPSGLHPQPEPRSCWQSWPAGWLDNCAFVPEKTRSRRRRVTVMSDPHCGRKKKTRLYLNFY